MASVGNINVRRPGDEVTWTGPDLWNTSGKKTARKRFRIYGAAALSLFLMGQEAPAQRPAGESAPTESAQEFVLPEVIVTATKIEIPLEQVGASVTVITAKEIERRKARDVLDLLRGVPGFTIVQAGSRGGRTSTFVRGGEPDYNLVMIDGVQINQAGGFFNFANLAADNIERIEIIRGPLSSLYGSDAIASTINIISKRGKGPLKAELVAQGGSYHTTEERLSLRGGIKKFGYSLSAGRYDTDGLLDLNNEAKNTSLRARFDLDPNPLLSLGLTVGYIQSDFNFPTDFVAGRGFPPIDPDQGRETEEIIVGFDLEFNANEWWGNRLKVGLFDYSNRDFDGNDPIPSDFSDIEVFTDERRLSVDYRQLFRGSPWSHVGSTLTLGFEFEPETFNQDRKTISSSGAVSRRNLDETRTTFAYYLQERLSISERLYLTAGFRFDDNSKFGSSFNPRGSIAYLLRSIGTKIRGAIGTGLKEPRFLETFGLGGIQGNSDLDPERSFSWEIGLDQTVWEGKLLLSATYFQNRYKDMIALVGSFLVGTYQNIQEAESHGLETGFTFRLSEEIRFGGAYTYLETEVTDAGGLTNTSFVEGEQLLRRPRHGGSFFIDVRWGDLQANLSGTVVGDRIDRDFAASSSGRRVVNNAFGKLDLAASYRVIAFKPKGRELRLRLLIRNLLNNDYQETFGIESPGINVLGGIELRW